MKNLLFILVVLGSLIACTEEEEIRTLEDLYLEQPDHNQFTDSCQVWLQTHAEYLTCWETWMYREIPSVEPIPSELCGVRTSRFQTDGYKRVTRNLNRLLRDHFEALPEGCAIQPMELYCRTVMAGFIMPCPPSNCEEAIHGPEGYE